MLAANLAFINVGERRYAIDTLNPLEAIDWGVRVAVLLGGPLGRLLGGCDLERLKNLDPARPDPDSLGLLKDALASGLAGCAGLNAPELTDLLTQALRRCYTPENEALRDEAVFNRWFREHPGDLYPLGVKAVQQLVADFFPKTLVTLASVFPAPKTSSADPA